MTPCDSPGCTNLATWEFHRPDGLVVAACSAHYWWVWPGLDCRELVLIPVTVLGSPAELRVTREILDRLKGI